MAQSQIILFLGPDNKVHAEMPSANGARKSLGTLELSEFPLDIIEGLAAQQNRIDAKISRQDKIARATEIERKKRIFALSWERHGPAIAAQVAPEIATSYTYGSERKFKPEGTLSDLNDL